MNIDLTAMPTSLDAGHFGLAILALLFFILFITKKSAPKETLTSQTAKPDTEVPAPKAPAKLKDANPDAALQLLTLLQQEARLVDFLNEDLGDYADADIGAAARVVHEGGQKVLKEYFTLAPVREEEEESRITLAEGFNATEVRLTGNVVGQAPFTGTLIHRGWKATQVKLPKLAEGHDAKVIAAAEVEL